MVARLCVHCGVRSACRPRGLCYRDFYTPAVRALYPSTSKYARLGAGTGNARRPLPAVPCQHQPGSNARIRTLAARVAAGEQLFHPQDAGVVRWRRA